MGGNDWDTASENLAREREGKAYIKGLWFGLIIGMVSISFGNVSYSAISNYFTEQAREKIAIETACKERGGHVVVENTICFAKNGRVIFRR